MAEDRQLSCTIPVSRSMAEGRVARLLRRLAAGAYDLLVLAGVLMLTSLLLIIGRGGAAIPQGSPAFQLFLAAQTGLYFIGFWSRGGQTPGMRAWNIRIETLAGAAPSAATAATRLAAALLSAVPLGLGFLWLLIDRDGYAWHDRLSRTRVVSMARTA